MRFKQLTLAMAVTASLALNGSGVRSDTSPSGRSQAWSDVLRTIDTLTPGEQAAKASSQHSNPSATDTEKEESAYMLGRLLQADARLLIKIDPSMTNSWADGGAAVKALALFQEASKLPALHDQALGHAIDVATAAGDEQTLRTILVGLLSQTKDPQKQAQYNYTMAQSYLRSSDYASALPGLTAAQILAPDSNFALGSSYYQADLALSGHNPKMTTDKAIDALRDYIRKSPDGRFAREIVTRLKSLPLQKDNPLPNYTPTTADHALFAQVYFEANDWGDCLAELAQAPPDTKPSQKAICLAKTGKADAAKKALLQTIKAEPDYNYAPTATLICAYLTREQSKQLWLEILKAKPSKSDAAMWNIAIRSDPPDSLNYFRNLIAAYPTSEFAPESTWWLFWNYAKKAPADPAMIAQAIPIAHAGLERYPETRAAERFAFWLGKLHELAKHPEQAAVDYQYLVGHFPTSYYSYRARARLAALTLHHAPALNNAASDAAKQAKPVKDPLWSTHPGRTDYEAQWKWPAPEQFLSDKAIEKKYGPNFEELYKLGQLDECLEMLTPATTAEFKSSLQAKNNEPLQAINTVTHDISGPAGHSLRWQMAYPLVYAAEVQSEAQLKGVDPLLVHALIREESRYNHRALSRSNAIGLMQLLPATASGVAKRLGVPFKSNEDFYQPPVNIKLGTDYLSYVLGRYNGNAMFAVASYNGGPNAVKSWLKAHEQGNAGDYDFFVENIPTRETRDYVRKVFGAYWIYNAIYANKPPATPAG